MLFLIPCWGCPDQPMPVFGSPHHRQDREERLAETTADVQERSRGTTATREDPTLPRGLVGRSPLFFGPSSPRRGRTRWPRRAIVHAGGRVRDPLRRVPEGLH